MVVSLAIDIGVSGGLDTFCLFFGCGSMVDETLCLERTGTGIVFRDISRPGVMLDGLPGFGLGSDMRTGLWMPTGLVDGWSLSIGVGGRKVVGRRFGSGFSTMWDGIPPCVTNVGETDDGGKGTKVCRLRDLMFSRRRF